MSLIIEKKNLLVPLNQNFTSFLLDLSSNPHNKILKIWLEKESFKLKFKVFIVGLKVNDALLSGSKKNKFIE